MKTPTETMDAINGILVRNKDNITRISEICREVNAHVDTYIGDPLKLDMTMLSELQLESIDLDKKTKDNLVTLQDFIARAIMSTEFYEGQANIFLKKTSHIYNNFPSSSPSGVSLPVTVIFKNMGMFYSWTLDKGIFLNIILMDSDNNVLMNTDYTFDPTITGNEPGNETSNEDYLKDKTFNIVVNIPVCPVGEYSLVLTIKDATYTFFDSYKPTIQIT